jgi:hypothetical protein
MLIKELAKKPELLEITLDSQDIVLAYGEPVIFWMKDYLDVSTYFEFYQSQADNNSKKLGKLVKQLILNSKGEPAMSDEEELPVDIIVAALTKINENMGKSKAKLSIPVNGAQ